jgi:hypothetical protein
MIFIFFSFTLYQLEGKSSGRLRNFDIPVSIGQPRQEKFRERHSNPILKGGTLAKAERISGEIKILIKSALPVPAGNIVFGFFVFWV